jgi:hypothetical protein
MFYGLVHAISFIQGQERVASFVVTFIHPLLEIARLCVQDLEVCEQLLLLFCDFAEKIREVKLANDQILTFLQATSELFKIYSSHHCMTRAIQSNNNADDMKEEEEKAYEDILCALILLKNVLRISQGDLSISADVSFFGLQQLIPLMTQGLLSYPRLCSEYFSVVSILAQRFPIKIPSLPTDLLQGLLRSLEMGVAHHDAELGKKSLSSLEGLYKLHLQTGLLHQQLEDFPELFQSGITAVVRILYQPYLWDRLEATSAVLLVFLALDAKGFISISEQVANQSKLQDPSRFQKSLEKLIQPQIIEKSRVLASGYEVSFP